MGRGDKRTEKGKRFKGSYGNSRPQKEAVAAVAAEGSAERAAKKAAKEAAKEVTAKKAPPRKPAAKKGEE